MFFQSLTAAFNCYNFQYLLATILSLDNVGTFFFLTMTRKPTRLTHVNNASINRHDVLHPSVKSFETVHRVRLDLACHLFSTKVMQRIPTTELSHSSQSWNLVYCISCRRCPVLYIGETERNLRSRFSERLRSIRLYNNTPELPVAQHFNSTGHCISDVQVRGVGMARCCGTDIQPKQRELRVFLQLGTVQT